MPPLKCYPCVICCKRTKPAERRNLNGEKNKEIRKYLVNKLFIRPQEVIECVTCNKCRLFCGKEIQKKQTTKRKAEYLDNDPDPDFIPVVRSSSKNYVDCRSPPSNQLKLPSTTGSHACFANKLVFKVYSLYCIINKPKAVKRTRPLQIWRMDFPS
ncbi:unnamed protein product [Mytilus coruscus]|uniref:Uncharacterized protein n=1 Tax=Mytilus coruscus TaxID=42192 RepID=A0A6J8CHY3_MYTCO|nr:unnamed protein product [Mytilus coruscus]